MGIGCRYVLGTHFVGWLLVSAVCSKESWCSQPPCKVAMSTCDEICLHEKIPSSYKMITRYVVAGCTFTCCQYIQKEQAVQSAHLSSRLQRFGRLGTELPSATWRM